MILMSAKFWICRQMPDIFKVVVALKKWHVT